MECCRGGDEKRQNRPDCQDPVNAVIPVASEINIYDLRGYNGFAGRSVLGWKMG